MRKVELFIASRYLQSKRKEVFISIITVISVLAVALSAMVLNMVLAIMTGFESELVARLVSSNAHITIRSASMVRDWEQVVLRVRELPGVVDAFPYTYSQAMISVSGGGHGLLLRGIYKAPAAQAKLKELLEQGYESDILFKSHAIDIERPDGVKDTVNLPPLVVGATLRQRLQLEDGQPVTILAPRFGASPQGLVPKLRRFLVVGSYSSGLVEYENGVAYINMSDAQSFFEMGNAVSGVEVVISDVMKAKEARTAISEALSDLNSVHYVSDWMTQNGPILRMMGLEKRVYFIVLLLLVLIASFSIVSTLIMVVMEKSKDIAILKSMGATNGFVLRVFLIQGNIIGVVGTILGTLCGYLGCVGLREFGFPIEMAVFGMDTVPVYLVPENFIVVAISTIIITSLAGVYPARRASKINPADVLRFE